MLAGGAAHAQSSVTLYGMVDAGLLYTSKTASSTGANAGSQFSFVDSGQSPSQFGLTGTEDLGGGLKASFKLESGISMANGGFGNSNGNMFGRQAWIGLENNYGEVKAGLQFSPFFLSLFDLDPRGVSQFGSGLVNYVNNAFVTGIFNANSISYTSPVFYGFQGSALYAFGGSAGDFQAGRQYSANLKYDNGTVMVEAAFYDGNVGTSGTSAPAISTVGFEGRMIGTSYKIGNVTLKASFTNYKGQGESSVGYGAINNNVYGGGVDWLVLPQLALNGGVWFTSDRNDTSNHSLLGAVGANYFLSRASTLYAQFGLVDNRGTMNTGISINNALNGVPNATTFGAEIGIRHIF
ncbi:porin [Paraburkholderia sp. Ac-20347]|uniref:porin n=1 Tax=Paraburkholderia sp. Ac-20347 TaxID=2703892 RepID=UPI00197F2EB9|nr:porin [Paraburkholderia sp. Ac-20347]MBN3813739.1 porin [Paraburkholderia sp. Ac-20347]